MYPTAATIGVSRGEEFLDLEPLQSRDEYVRAAVGQVDALHDLGSRAYGVEIVGLGAVEVVLDHHEADHPVGRQGFLDDLYVLDVAYHDRREDSGKYRTPRKRDDGQLVGQDLVDGYYLILGHILASWFARAVIQTLYQEK